MGTPGHTFTMTLGVQSNENSIQQALLSPFLKKMEIWRG
jgi:hypothetical protein